MSNAVHKITSDCRLGSPVVDEEDDSDGAIGEEGDGMADDDVDEEEMDEDNSNMNSPAASTVANTESKEDNPEWATLQDSDSDEMTESDSDDVMVPAARKKGKVSLTCLRSAVV